MIEKLVWIDTDSQMANIANEKALQHKINELVDAVNGILAAQEQYATIYNEDIVPMLMPENKELADNSEKANCQENVQDRMIGCTTLDIPESYKTDPYSEQRKWIGKLCKFWFADAKHPTFGILDFVDAGPHPEPFHINCNESEQGWYPHCELVKPDDDIIYKGE